MSQGGAPQYGKRTSTQYCGQYTVSLTAPYAGIAGDSSYPEPWSKSFRQLTVRQLMNRISEHIGPRGAWILSGSKDDRFFFSFQYGFQR